MKGTGDPLVRDVNGFVVVGVATFVLAASPASPNERSKTMPLYDGRENTRNAC